MKIAAINEEPLFCPPLSMYLLNNAQELSFCYPHFHNGKEYIWILLLPVIKNYDTYSFERLMMMLMVYMSLRGRVVAIELDLMKWTHEIDIVWGQMVETIRDVSASQEAIELFHRVFVA